MAAKRAVVALLVLIAACFVAPAHVRAQDLDVAHVGAAGDVQVVGKTLCFLRHAQAVHNKLKEEGRYAAAVRYRDPPLTALGREQVMQAGMELEAATLHKVISSPMRRALETAVGVVSLAGTPKPKPIEAWPALAEHDHGRAPCDTGSPVSQLAPDFPSVDFGDLGPNDQWWPAGETRKQFLRRVNHFAARLCSEHCPHMASDQRPCGPSEPNDINADGSDIHVLVSSHGGFLHELLGVQLRNAERRCYSCCALCGERHGA